MNIDLPYNPMERHIASALSGFVRELRLVDLSHYIGYVHNEKHNCLADIVVEAAKLYFAPGFIRFEDVAGANADWGSESSISLNISLNGSRARIFVNISIFEEYATVKLVYTSPHLQNADTQDLEDFCCRELAENYIGRRRLSQLVNQTAVSSQPDRLRQGFGV